MLVSYIVRLIDGARQEGRVVGEVQAVGTGRRTPVRTDAELIRALLAEGDEPIAIPDDVIDARDSNAESIDATEV